MSYPHLPHDSGSSEQSTRRQYVLSPHGLSSFRHNSEFNPAVAIKGVVFFKEKVPHFILSFCSLEASDRAAPLIVHRMSRVTKAYKSEPRRSNLFNKEKRGIPSQKTSERTSDRSSELQSGTPTNREPCSDANLENKLSDSSSTPLGIVGEGPGPMAHKLWNARLGGSSVS